MERSPEENTTLQTKRRPIMHSKEELCKKIKSINVTGKPR